MLEKYINSYKELTVDLKREILLKEIKEILDVIETLCIKRGLDIEKMNSYEYIYNKELLGEEDYYNLLFIYTICIKEDLANLL